MKTNPPFVYKYAEIPTEITYESGMFNVEGASGEKILVGSEVPEGGFIEILDAKWGLDSDQTIDVPKVFIEDHTDPNIIMRTNEYKYPYTTVTKNNPKKWNGAMRPGFYYKEYRNQGYWGGNIAWFGSRKPSNDPTHPNHLNINHQRKNHINQYLYPNSSYVFETIITCIKGGGHNRGGWNEILFHLESDDKARLIIKAYGPSGNYRDGQTLLDFESDAGRSSGWKRIDMIVNGKYSFKLYCGNGGGNGYIRCKVLKYWKQKGVDTIPEMSYLISMIIF